MDKRRLSLEEEKEFTVGGLSGGESDYEQGNYTVYLLILKRNRSRDESFIAAP